MLRFLLDANISHETAEFLNFLGHDAKTVAQFSLEEAEDAKIAEKAVKTKRIIIALDSDFGEIFYFSREEKLGIIVLKLRDQTVESVNKQLEMFLKTKILEKKEYQSNLIIIEEGRVRIRKKSAK